MDVDAFVAAHRGEWQRLEELSARAGRRRGLSGAEVDELVTLYQRATTHLSVVQSQTPDPVLIGRLSALVARGRDAVTGGGTPAWREVGRFFTVTFPAVVYRAGGWCLGVAAAFMGVAVAIGIWVATTPSVQRALAPPEDIQQLVNNDFEDYYSANPASSFAAQVWTNNAFLTAGVLVAGVLLLPTIGILLQNAVSVGEVGGFMFAGDRGGLFFGLILPHGLLELTAVWVGAGIGLRLGWTLIDPGRRRRMDALAVEGRSAVSAALGLAVVLAITGVIEAFVTPSGLPTWARVGVGITAEVLFLVYVVVLGRRAVRAGETGDLALGRREDIVATA